MGVRRAALLALVWTAVPVLGIETPPDSIEEVVVVAKTGSRITRQADYATPLAEYDARALDNFAPTTSAI